MAKISYDSYIKMLADVEVTDEKILEYSKVVKGDGGFDLVLAPDPQKVELTPEDLKFESALNIGNNISRRRRARRFEKRIKRGVDLPVLVSEGDSWFQFPFLIKEVIDHLEDDFLIWSVGAAGDTASNMVFGPSQKYKTEYMRALKSQKECVRGFLFSAAGNDIIGEDPDTKKAALFDILKDFNGDESDIYGHINFAVLGEKLHFLKTAYLQVIANIRAEPEFENLPIFIHGYDYVFPYPFGDNDHRNPPYAQKDEWLGEPLAGRNIFDPEFRRNIVMVLINSLYDVLKDIAGVSTETGIWVVDCRGAMPDLTDWNDEIHGTSKGFAKVAERFKQIIDHGLRVASEAP